MSASRCRLSFLVSEIKQRFVKVFHLSTRSVDNVDRFVHLYCPVRCSVAQKFHHRCSSVFICFSFFPLMCRCHRLLYLLLFNTRPFISSFSFVSIFTRSPSILFSSYILLALPRCYARSRRLHTELIFQVSRLMFRYLASPCKNHVTPQMKLHYITRFSSSHKAYKLCGYFERRKVFRCVIAVV